MKTILVLLAAVAFASAAQPRRFYHESFGIREATRIKQVEDAADFDGARIVGGAGASLGAFPYAAGLLISLPGNLTSVCGATLLSNYRALTAAQCWWDGSIRATEVTVVLGSVYLFYGGLRVISREVATHEYWDPYRNVNDLAMINLEYVPFSNVIQPILLPIDNYDTFVGVYAEVAGYGYQGDDYYITANQYLSYTTVPVITNAQCSTYFPAYIFESNICTSGEAGRSPCVSDNGGPLSTYDVYGRRVLIGVTQFISVFGCESGYPAAYSRVSYYLPWIQRYL